MSTDTPDTIEPEQAEKAYQERPARIQNAIDILAEYDEPSHPDQLAEAAAEEDIDYQRAYLVANKWGSLIEFRRSQMARPMEADTIEQEMALDSGE